MSYLALDYGSARTGVAVSPDGSWVFPRPALLGDLAENIEQINQLVQQEGVKSIVLGNPIAMDGSHSGQTDEVQTVFARLQELFPSLSLSLADERLTTKQAEVLLKERGGKIAPGERDSMAAVLILEQFLERTKS